MKLTFFGLTISSSWGNGHATPYRAILRALAGMGHEIHFFEKDVEYYSSRRDFVSCDYCRLTLYEDWDSIRRTALDEARVSDAVITASYLPEGQRINDEILELAHPLRVYYDLDTPITLRNLEGGGVSYLQADQLPAFDLVLSFTGGPILAQLQTLYGARATRALYGCVDPDVYHRVESSADYACDLSYMGTYAPDRQPGVERLFLDPARLHPEKQFMLAGSMYPGDWSWPENVCRAEHIAPGEHSRFYSSSRITLNITRTEMARNGWCPSGRFFEAAACGTPLISDRWDGLSDFFDTRREIRVVQTAADVEEALKMGDADLRRMAARARHRTLEEHTGAVRARQLLQFLSESRSDATVSAGNVLDSEMTQ
ncbi:MAG TPA: glycosyltransferase [Candidatus Angelobacter sp.]|nr:glycosyltransferase [Candidatus Angelobacter sp.]